MYALVTNQHGYDDKANHKLHNQNDTNEQEKKIQNLELKLQKYEQEIVHLQEELDLKTNKLIKKEKDEDEHNQLISYQNDKLLMQQAQILNQDDKIDRLLLKIATLEEQNKMAQMKSNYIIVILLCIITAYITIIIQHEYYNSK
ncbi:unnamed protein product [Adineta steineri]|uniref:Uncharacterized protein n=1 Tax=Adineta steineri TaxID=433720 RepID=A0A813PJN0_9BILA|nr:unnamed protein product [Adineta steineri]CAF3798301.1 unnamed protein product [Adineta steineri]